MAERPDPDDEEIRRLLEGGPADIREGVARIFDRYTGIVCGGIRRTFRWLAHEDLADAWQNTLVAVLEKALTGALDTKRPLIGLLWVIVSRRCCDVLNTAARQRTAFQAYSAAVANAVGLDETVGVEWAEAFHVLDKAILDLPPVQRAIWVAYRDAGFCATDEELFEALSKTSKRRKPWTLDCWRSNAPCRKRCLSCCRRRCIAADGWSSSASA